MKPSHQVNHQLFKKQRLLTSEMSGADLKHYRSLT